MLIRVMYQNGKYDMVHPYLLTELIALKKIRKFFRSGAWAVIGKDPVRGYGGKYYGPDRRAMDRSF